jgi:hypothetical protein
VFGQPELLFMTQFIADVKIVVDANNMQTEGKNPQSRPQEQPFA